MPKPRFLLLNPPGSQRFTRDCLHSNVTKGVYYWHQLDLLLQSGWLGQVAEVSLIDAVAERLDDAQTLRRCVDLDPNYILFMTGEKSFPEDQVFISRLHSALPRSELFASGDVVFFRGEKPFEEFEGLRGVLTDFGSDGLKRFLEGERGMISGLRYLDESGNVVAEGLVKGPLYYPEPLHSIFPRENYALPFGSPLPFASVLTNFGCPFPCSYCNAKDVGFRKREVEEVLSELSSLKDQGYRKIYFRDPTFATRAVHGLKLCEEMVERDLVFEWNAFTRPDILSEELLSAMSASGCKVLQFGIETPDFEMLQSHRKKFKDEKIRSVVQQCHAQGIKVCGHFMIGFPEEDPDGWDSVVDYALDLNCDYFALNMAEVRLGTTLDKSPPAMELNRKKLFFDEKKLNAAVDRMNRRFYLRPSFVVQQLASVRTRAHLGRLVNLGLQMLMGRR